MTNKPFFLLSALMIACTTGENYPTKYSTSLCETMYACIDNDTIETFLNYDDVEECKSEQESDFRETTTYDSYEEGDLTFNKEAADSCLEEINEVQSDSDCDGEMDVFSFLADMSSDDCTEVYQEAE